MSLLPFNGSWAKSRLIWFAGGPEASRGEGEPQPQSRRGDAEQSPAESEAELASRRDVTPPRQSREQQLSLDEQHERLILGLHHLGERAEVLRQSYLRANNEATALIPDFSALNKLDPVNDLRWVNGVIEELNQIPSGNPQIDLVVPDRTVGQLRSLILRARTLINDKASPAGAEE